jgi:hypothetical protein
VVLAGIATPPGRRRREAVMTALAPILEAFFTDRLMTQRGASPHTIAPYRDTFTLLLGHIYQQAGKLLAELDLADWTPPPSVPSCSSWKPAQSVGRGSAAEVQECAVAWVNGAYLGRSARAGQGPVGVSRQICGGPIRS